MSAENRNHHAPRIKAAPQLKKLVRELIAVRSEMLRLESEAGPRLGSLHETQRESARNLLHYLALRRHDLRKTQQRLAEHGLSSLGRSEPHVKRNLDAVIGALRSLAGTADESDDAPAVGSYDGREVLESHTRTARASAP